jgi:hypothetical protein
MSIKAGECPYRFYLALLMELKMAFSPLSLRPQEVNLPLYPPTPKVNE